MCIVSNTLRFCVLIYHIPMYNFVNSYSCKYITLTINHVKYPLKLLLNNNIIMLIIFKD